MDFQPIYNIAEICHQAGITEAILSPGSRCAPLVLAFARHPGINCRTVPDERTAAFIALGIAQIKKKPVVLVCTSGSAAYNYAPAISEAGFRNIPLLVLTADRPPEWIGQLDGQTIWQNNIYGNHVKYSNSALADLSHADAKWHLNRILNEAIRTSIAFPPGPAHINIPFREPFYPDPSDDTYFESDQLYVRETTYTLDTSGYDEFKLIWEKAERKLILAGQTDIDASMLTLLAQLSSEHHIPVMGDIISNVHKVPESVQLADTFIQKADSNSDGFKPDLLITFGLSVLSKNIKNFFRENTPAHHWHIQPAGEIADPFKSLTTVVRSEPYSFLKIMSETATESGFKRQKQENYHQLLRMESDRVRRKTAEFFSSGDQFGEFELVWETIRQLPHECNLHLANSMAVRYANYCGIMGSPAGVTVYSNRGTCGIDGCNSTAVGSSLADEEKLNILITGDVGFFYDRNAFWHNYPMHNLRIILLNNHGGGIFRMIPGPSRLPELDTYFETVQSLSARSLAAEFGFEYLQCDKRSKMNHFIKEIMTPDKRTKILELETDSRMNTEILRNFKQNIR